MKLISSVSARPNFVKLAAIVHAQQDGFPGVAHSIVHTGQHYDPLFSDVFFEQLAIPAPAHNLGIAGGTRDEVIEATYRAFLPLFKSEKPDVLLVYGDVNGAVGAARAAAEAGVPIAHVEAGLRSRDMDMPEEINRIEIDKISTWLFCTEPSGVENIQTEGLTGRVELVGNTMIDTLVRMTPLIEAADLPGDLPPEYAVLTLHRPSNVDTDEALKTNIDFINEIAARVPVILPVHHRLQAALERSGLGKRLHQSVHPIAPLGYVPFLRVVQDCAFILTDSGGLQEEATFLRKRCFTMRRNTERPITIMSGSNTLIDPALPDDRGMVLAFAEAKPTTEIAVPPLWDGKAGERILQILTTA